MNDQVSPLTRCERCVPTGLLDPQPIAPVMHRDPVGGGKIQKPSCKTLDNVIAGKLTRFEGRGNSPHENPPLQIGPIAQIMCAAVICHMKGRSRFDATGKAANDPKGRHSRV